MDGINKKILAEYAPGYLAAQEAAEEAKDDLWAGMLAAEESAKTRIEQKRQERIQQLTHEERWRARLPPSRSVTWILPAHQEVRPPTVPISAPPSPHAGPKTGSTSSTKPRPDSIDAAAVPTPRTISPANSSRLTRADAADSTAAHPTPAHKKAMPTHGSTDSTANASNAAGITAPNGRRVRKAATMWTHCRPRNVPTAPTKSKN